MSTISPPIVLSPPGDIEVFATLEGLRRYFEPFHFDVELKRGFDSEGRLLQLSFDGFDAILTPLESSGTHAKKARRLLVRFLWDRSDFDPKTRPSLSELFKLALPYAEDVRR